MAASRVYFGARYRCELALYPSDGAADEVETGAKAQSEEVLVGDASWLPETARTISINIIEGAVILILYIVIRIALKFVTALANLVSKLPILNQLNQLGGIIYGILRGVLIIYILLLLVNLSGEIEPQNHVYMAVEESYIGKVMNENNILDILFTKVSENE